MIGCEHCANCLFLHSNLELKISEKNFSVRSSLVMELTEDQRRRMQQKKAEALAKRKNSAVQGGLTDQQRREMEEKRKAARQIQLTKGQQPTPSTARAAPLTAAQSKNLLGNNFYSKPARILKGSCSLVSPGRFEIDVGYHGQLIETLRNLPSAQYNATKKTWSFLVVDHDSVLRKLLPLKSEVVISPLPNWILKTFSKPRDLTPDQVDIGAIEPYLYDNLMPFQKEGIKFGVSRQGRVLIADDMGLGKTVQALGLASYYDQHWPVLIVCQSTLKYNWHSSVLRWLPHSVNEQEISVISSGKDYIGSDKFVIISYDLVSKKLKELQEKNYQFVIVDESHCIKDYKSGRTKAVEPLLKASKCLVLLSGTPALSKPIELYTQINVLDPALFSFVSDFGNRYCDGKMKRFGEREIPDYNGHSFGTELSLLLSERVMIRRLKSEVLQQLPSKQRTTVTLDPAGVETKTKVMKDRRAENAKDNLKGMDRHAFILEWYGQTAQAKVKAVQSYIKDLLSGGDKKFLVFAHHQVMMKAVSEAVEREGVAYIFIDGQVSSNLRNERVNMFQTSDKVRVAVLSITAANAGITLTAANLVVFAELFWNPGVLTQAEDRAHRIGQTDSVSVQYLVARETADDVMWPMIQSKLSVLNQAGLSKDNFEESESKVLEDTRPNKIKECFDAQKLQADSDDMEALLADIMEDDFNDDSPPKKIKL